jgi:hypothetical protein
MGRITMAVVTPEQQLADQESDRRNFPLSFWYHHRHLGNTLLRCGMTLDALRVLPYGGWYGRDADGQRFDRPRVEPGGTVTTEGEDGPYGRSGRVTWLSWIDVLDLPNVGPVRMLELVNWLRRAKVEAPWLADWDEFSQNFAALRGRFREPPVPEDERR